MSFPINDNLLKNAQIALSKRENLFWVVGGAGSGKTTICQRLSQQFNLPLYDMDAHIYGTYHGRFSQTRHPVNKSWAAAPNGLAWLLNKTWDEFNNFNQAALPEYLDLLVEDLEKMESDATLLIDGGICNPAILAQALPPKQIVCLARPGLTSLEIWNENEERRGMKAMIDQLPEPETAWQTFIEFDTRITQTILQECQESNIRICTRNETDSVAQFTQQVADALQINVH